MRVCYRFVARAAGLLAGTALSLSVPAARAQDSTAHTRLVVLGTGTPNADPDRFGPAVAVVAGGHAYLVDAGAGVVRRAAAAARNGIAALDAPKLDIVFVTHLHSDHTVGMPDLLLSPWTLGRTTPLRVFGPPGIAEMMQHLRQAYDADIRNRVDGLEPANETGFASTVHVVRPGVVYRDSAVTVRAIEVPHGDWAHAYAYRFETRDRTIVVSGDMRPNDAIVSACDGCDVLVHEVYSATALTRRPPDWQKYHVRAHTSTTELAAIATRAHPKLLVLYHQLYWGVTDDDLIREIRTAGYTGPVVSAHDLGVY